MTSANFEPATVHFRIHGGHLRVRTFYTSDRAAHGFHLSSHLRCTNAQTFYCGRDNCFTVAYLKRWMIERTSVFYSTWSGLWQLTVSNLFCFQTSGILPYFPLLTS